MIRLVRSELVKLMSTRTAWILPLGMALLGAVFVGITGGFMLWGQIPTPTGPISPADAFDESTMARTVYTGGVQLGYLLGLVLGILAIGAEFRHRTLTGAFLAAPRRGPVLVAKAVAVAIVAAGNALVHALACFGVGAALLAARGLPVAPDPTDLVGVAARIVLVIVLWALMGLGLGTLVTNQVAALALGVGVAWIMEPLLGFLLTFAEGGEKVARWLPSQATSAALSVFEGADPAATQAMGGPTDPLSWWVAALVLLGYALAMFVPGWLLLRRRDVG